MVKKLYINEHTIQRIKERVNFDILSLLSKMNENFEIKITDILQSKHGIDVVKKALIINNRYILPLRSFEKNGVEHYKILSILYETQFFSSVNLNFGMHSEIKSVRFNTIENKEVYFKQNEYNEITDDVENINWNFNIIEGEKEKKVIKVSDKYHKNYFMKKYQLPIYIKTFRNNILKIV